MKQLSKEEAIEFYEGGKWKDWPKRAIAGFQLYQKLLCVPFSVFHEAIEEALGRPVWTHEFGLNHDGLVAEYLGQAEAPTFEQIMEMIPAEKRIIIASDRGA